MKGFIAPLLIGIVFIILGLLVSKFKCYWLIAGYNTMGEKEKNNIDIDKVGKVIGLAVFLIGIFIAVGGILSQAYPMMEIVTLLGTVLILLIMFIRIHKYTHNKGNKGETIFTSATLGIAAMIIIIMVAGTTEKNKIIFEDNKVVIDNSFGTTIYKEEIETVSLLDSMPKILKRTGGASLGYYKKGNFELEGDREVKIYLERKEGPFVKVVTKNHDIYLNFKEKGKGKEIYLRLREFI